MTRALGSAALMMLPWLLLNGVALGDVSVEQALKIAEKYVGGPLSRPTTNRIPDADRFLQCFYDGEHGRESVTVDLKLGRASGYFRGFPEWPGKRDGVPCPPPTIALDVAEQTAKSEARKRMGPDFAGITSWRTRAEPEKGYVTVYGSGRERGAPPRPCTSPHCYVRVSLLDGSTCAFGYNVPVSPDPIPCKVSADQAVEIARDAVEDKDARVNREPHLYQEPNEVGVLTWSVIVVPKVREGQPVRALWVDVNAVTGDVLTVRDAYIGGGPAGTSSGRHRPAILVVAASAAGTLLCVAAAVVVLRRRRR